MMIPNSTLCCRYYDKRDAEDAMDAMDGAIFDGRELRVQTARYGRPNDSYSRRYGGGRPRRRYRWVVGKLTL